MTLIKTARQHCTDTRLSEIFGDFTHTKLLNNEFHIITTQSSRKNGEKKIYIKKKKKKNL